MQLIQLETGDREKENMNYRFLCVINYSDRIEEFIDENKALMRRMYGDFQTTNSNRPPDPEDQTSPKRKRDAPGVPDITAPHGDSYFDKWRNKRQSDSNSDRPVLNPPTEPKSNKWVMQCRWNHIINFKCFQNPKIILFVRYRLDVCETRIEIVTPYWASNSAGKIRAIVNTQHFEQAIHQELCTYVQTNGRFHCLLAGVFKRDLCFFFRKNKTSRCGDDCGCEQKYKWHRLLAYDPDDNCKGIFMDWFLFPSCCVCRCDPRWKSRIEFRSLTLSIDSCFIISSDVIHNNTQQYCYYRLISSTHFVHRLSSIDSPHRIRCQSSLFNVDSTVIVC